MTWVNQLYSHVPHGCSEKWPDQAPVVKSSFALQDQEMTEHEGCPSLVPVGQKKVYNVHTRVH